jgi:hypothetical protein
MRGQMIKKRRESEDDTKSRGWTEEELEYHGKRQE